MRKEVRAELLKLRTARTFWGFAATILGLVIVITVLALALDKGSLDDSEDNVRSLLSTAGGGALLVLVLGVVFGAGEFRHGTIAWTLLVTPDRFRVIAAKTLASAIAGLVVGVAIAAVTAVIALPWLSAKGVAMPSTGELIELFLGGILYTTLAGALGTAVGMLLRNQVAAIVLVLVVLFVIDPTLSVFIDGYEKYSLSGLNVAMSGGPAEDVGGDVLPLWSAALVWGAYTGALAAAAAVLMSRRDI